MVWQSCGWPRQRDGIALMGCRCLFGEAFSGKNSPVQDMIALNSGAALYIADIVNSINDGVELSFELMRNGNAANKLESYVEASNQL